jgi:hypothetical protein
LKLKNGIKKKRRVLEIKFAQSILDAIDNILERPQSYSIRYKKIRFAHPKKFPFDIHYYIDENIKSVITIAIIHEKEKMSLRKIG